MIKIQGITEQQQKIYYTYDENSIPLGEGGMGTVYQGYCFKEDNDRDFIPVAIKHITVPSKEVIDRAVREASIQINHPCLLRMYGFIPNMELDKYTNSYKPEYYLVMERLVGVSLENLIQGVTIAKSGEKIDYAAQLYDLYMNDRDSFLKEVMPKIFEGVKTLHDSGVVHRDIDPSNIMVTIDGNIKLIDFGVSKVVGTSISNVSKQTQHGAIIGKIDYAAPEIILGDVDNHNFSTDIYAIGILLYQLSAGALPFRGDSSQIMQDQLTSPLPLINISNPKLQKVIEKATSKKQCDRYQNISDLIADFDQIVFDSSLSCDEEKEGEPKSLSWLYILLGFIGIILGIILAAKC